MDKTNLKIELKDGRILGYAEYGDLVPCIINSVTSFGN